MRPTRHISATIARRLTLMRQHLAGPRESLTTDGIMKVMRDLDYVQIDPTSTVAPSHLLVLWSRLGPYDQTHLDRLLWKERLLFEDWAQCTSIVLTEDYPIFHALKRGYLESKSPRGEKIRAWLKENTQLQHYILSEIQRRGPMSSRDLEDKSVAGWQSSGWSRGRNVGMMLTILWAQGKIMVAGREKRQKLWDLTERLMPEWVPREVLSDRELVWRAAQKSLRALGVATARHIERHFIRGCYPGLSSVLADLESEGLIARVQVDENQKISSRAGSWYVHFNDLPLLDRLITGDWEPRTTLLSPFDNMISDRSRTELLFNFRFSLEIYLPKPKRRYGFYVMPILQSDRLIGRVDLAFDKKQRQLNINAVYAEPDAPMTRDTSEQVACAMEELGEFLAAEKIVYSRHVPAEWKSQLS